jgi:serine/threonine-protein kinase
LPVTLKKDAREMLTTDLGACEWFVWDLRRSNLIDRGQLDQVIGEFLNKNPGAEPPALAEFLVAQGILTEFQAERLLQGKTQGFVLGPFTLMDALGTGSMGTVYKAQSKTDSNWYAVKVLPRRSMWNVRIARRKVRAFEQCKHPAVVPFVDVGTSGGMHYLAWPLVEGESLDKIVEREGRLSPERAALYAMQAAEGLEQTHQQELFHGLLKPSNLMIAPDGQVRILDFGIGCLLAETEGESLVDTMSTANSVNSGLDCASPESIMDPTNLTPIGDQYSLGCVLYYCLTGRYPFPEGTAVEKMMCHQHKQPTPILDLAPEVPPELVEVIEKLMQKKPEDRYPGGCPEVIEVLRPFAAASGGGNVRRTMVMPRTSAMKRERPPVAPPPAPVRPAGAAAAPPRAPAAPAKPPAAPPKALPARGPVLPARAPSALAAAKQPRPVPPRPPVRKPEPAAEPEFDQLEPAPEIAAHVSAAPETVLPTGPTVGQRLGNLGIVLLAILCGIVAYLASSMIRF